MPALQRRARSSALLWRAAMALGFAVLACRSGGEGEDLHERIQAARLKAEISFGHPAVLYSTPPSLDALEASSWSELLFATVAGSPEERARAITALGELGDPRAVPSLLSALSDARGTLRPCLAAESLGRLRDPRAVDALIEATRNSGNDDLKLCAIKALGLLRDERAVPALVGTLERRQMAIAAAYALARIGDPRGARAVVRAASDRRLRPWMVFPLGEFGMPEVVPALREIAANRKLSKTVREAANEGLWKTRVLTRRERVEALVEVLSRDASSRHRRWAAHRLGDEGHGSASEALARGLSDASDPVRLAAAVALVRLGPEVEASVVRVVGDSGPAGRYAIAVLGFVGGEGAREALERVRGADRRPLAETSLRWLALRGVRGEQAGTTPEAGEVMAGG